MGKHRDWTEIRQEYEKGASLQTLAKRHDISIGTIKKACARENWVKGKPKMDRLVKRIEKATQKGTAENGTIENGTTEKVPTVPFHKRIDAAAFAALQKIEAAIEFVPPEQVQALKQITGALKDLVQITGGSDLDREEQKARIDKLRAETRTEDAASRTVTVRFVDTEGGED